MSKYLTVLITVILLLCGCASAPRGMPPYLVLLTPTLPNDIGQCTGIAVAPRKIIAPKHCIKHADRAVTLSGQEVWIASANASGDHDIALLTTDRVLWVSQYAEFAQPALSKQATIYGYCSYMVSSVPRHAFYDGLQTVRAEDWPAYDYGIWIMMGSKICGGDSGSPVLQDGKVVGIVSLANIYPGGAYAGRVAFTIPVDYAQELIDHVQATN